MPRRDKTPFPFWQEDSAHYQMHQYRFRSWLFNTPGLRHLQTTDRWPDEGIGYFQLIDPERDRTILYVRPKNPALGAGRAGMKHRAMYICPGCFKHVPVGRSHQHKCDPFMLGAHQHMMDQIAKE